MLNPNLQKVKWLKTRVGSDGFICVVDVMGTDKDIVNAARVSYGNDDRSESPEMSDADVNLINYLLRNNHTTPFEMVEVKFLVRVPMDIWRQWIRHRTANVNEYSTRYKEAIDLCSSTQHDKWRLQATDNKQGSAGFLTDWPSNTDEVVEFPVGETRDNYSSPGTYLSVQERELQRISHAVYKERIGLGVAKEQARKDLPLSNYTEAYWKCDLHNIFNFLRLRMDSHAQAEIREYAYVMANLIDTLFPYASAAFDNYIRSSVRLSKKEIEAIQSGSVSHILNKREKEECLKKLEMLNIKLANQ